MMAHLGLDQTHLHDYIRSDSWSIRYALESSPADMVAWPMMAASTD